MNQIIRVAPREHYCLEVYLKNGSSLLLNLESRLHTVRFSVLEDPAVFESAETDGSRVIWGRKLELSLEELFQLARKE
ncbi:MAG: DUF2442 domain-containing protein [Clostridia bacterium]|nr:DUF2442 domain-containing protein [Clostridia bacterium]